jgi:phosphate transport system substrate-binding protein
MKQKKCWTLSIALLFFFNIEKNVFSESHLDAQLLSYQSVEGISGNLNSIGSDTLNNLMTFWAEGFKKKYPNVNIQVEGKGSSTAPPALMEGTAQLGPMSRPMKKEEMDRFETKYGFFPMAVGVALDALAVFVNKDNPLDSLTLAQVDGIFSKTRKPGFLDDITVWGQLGLKNTWANAPISLYGRNSASGTYGYFKEHALKKGDFRDTVKEQPGSAAVVLGVTEDSMGIGYSGIGYITSGVKPLLLSKGNEQGVAPEYENVIQGKYPLARLLYIYVVKKPNTPLPSMIEQFLIFVLSQEGQVIVEKDGYLPLTSALAKKQRDLFNKQ